MMHIFFFKEGDAVQNQEAWHQSSQMKKDIPFGVWVPEDHQVSYIHTTLWAHLFTYLGRSAYGHAAKALNTSNLCSQLYTTLKSNVHITENLNIYNHLYQTQQITGDMVQATII